MATAAVDSSDAVMYAGTATGNSLLPPSAILGRRVCEDKQLLGMRLPAVEAAKRKRPEELCTPHSVKPVFTSLVEMAHAPTTLCALHISTV